jgi:hypothetical protein
MPRIDLSIAYSLSSLVNEKDLGKVDQVLSIEDKTSTMHATTTIEADQEDVELVLDGVTACHFLAIRTNAEVDVKLDAKVNTPFTICPISTEKLGMFMICTCGVTKLFITTKTSPVQLLITAVGD